MIKQYGKMRIDCCNNQPSQDIKLSANSKISYHLTRPFAIINCRLAVRKMGMMSGYTLLDAGDWTAGSF
ncbi:hypothetical protein AALB47_23070 [Lachnospiraceae bacterium 54-11]